MNETKRIIYESAIKTIAQNGYERATMDDIACHAQVAKGTLYYHFKSKEDIFNYVVKEGLRDLEQSVEKEVALAPGYLDKIKAICFVNLRFLKQNKDLAVIILSQFAGQQTRQHQLKILLKDYVGFIEEYVKSAMAHGIIKKGVPSFIAINFLGIIISTSLYEIFSENPPSNEEIVKDLIDYLTTGSIYNK